MYLLLHTYILLILLLVHANVNFRTQRFLGNIISIGWVIYWVIQNNEKFSKWTEDMFKFHKHNFTIRESISSDTVVHVDPGGGPGDAVRAGLQEVARGQQPAVAEAGGVGVPGPPAAPRHRSTPVLEIFLIDNRAVND